MNHISRGIAFYGDVFQKTSTSGYNRLICFNLADIISPLYLSTWMDHGPAVADDPLIQYSLSNVLNYPEDIKLHVTACINPSFSNVYPLVLVCQSAPTEVVDELLGNVVGIWVPNDKLASQYLDLGIPAEIVDVVPYIDDSHISDSLLIKESLTKVFTRLSTNTSTQQVDRHRYLRDKKYNIRQLEMGARSEVNENNATLATLYQNSGALVKAKSYIDKVDHHLLSRHLSKEFISTAIQNSLDLYSSSKASIYTSYQEPSAKQRTTLLTMKNLFESVLPKLDRRTTGAIPVIWESPLVKATGTAEAARLLFNGLTDIPVYDIQARALDHIQSDQTYSKVDNKIIFQDSLQVERDNLVHIQMVSQRRVRLPKAPISILRTFCETDRIPKWLVEQCECFTEVWVPSTFCRKSFIDSGVSPEQLAILPGPFDFTLYRAAPRSDKMSGRSKFRFLSVFKWEYRKGWDILLRAYCEEFSLSDNVELIIKTLRYGPIDPQVQAQEFLKRIGINNPSPAPIRIINAELSSTEMANLYNSSDAFVLPTRGEAWGRPFMEAMAMGLPVVGTNWGGHLDFLTPDTSLLVDVEKLEDVPPCTDFGPSSGQWARPSCASLREKMREIYNNYIPYKNQVLDIHDQLTNQYNPGAITNTMVNRLESLIYREARLLNVRK